MIKKFGCEFALQIVEQVAKRIETRHATLRRDRMLMILIPFELERASENVGRSLNRSVIFAATYSCLPRIGAVNLKKAIDWFRRDSARACNVDSERHRLDRFKRTIQVNRW